MNLMSTFTTKLFTHRMRAEVNTVYRVPTVSSTSEAAPADDADHFYDMFP